MGNEQRGPPDEQLAQGGADQRLVVRVQVGGRFVENHQRRVLQKGAGDGDPLPLAPAEARALLADLGVVPTGQPDDERMSVGRTRRFFERTGRCVGPRQADVVGDGPLKEVRLLGDPGQLRTPGVRVQPGQGGAADEDLPAIRLQEAQQQGGHGALAGAGRPDQGHGLPGCEGSGEAAQRRTTPVVVGDVHLVEDDIVIRGLRRHGDCFDRLVGDRPVQHRKDPRRRRLARGAGVIGEGQLAQRHEKLRGEQQHRQRPFKGKCIRHQAQADLQRHQCRGRGGRPLQHERGLESGGQDFHGGAAEALTDGRDGRRLLTAAAERLERRQPLEHVQEVGAHPAHVGETALGQLAGAAADERHEHDQHRPRKEQHQRCQRVDEQNDQEDERGDECRQRSGGDELGYVAVQRFDAADRAVDQLAAALAAGQRRAQSDQTFREARAEPPFQTVGRALRQPFIAPQQHRAQRQRAQRRSQQRNHRVERLPAQEDPVDDAGDEQRLQDEQQRRAQAGAQHDEQQARGAAVDLPETALQRRVESGARINSWSGPVQPCRGRCNRPRRCRAKRMASRSGQ